MGKRHECIGYIIIIIYIHVYIIYIIYIERGREGAQFSAGPAMTDIGSNTRR
jgi:hypothetical protein